MAVYTVSVVLLCLVTQFVIGTSVEYTNYGGQQVLEQDDIYANGGGMSVMRAAPPQDPTTGKLAAEIQRSAWKPVCSSEDLPDHACRAALDGSDTTYWQTHLGAVLPQSMVIDLGGLHILGAISVLPSNEPSTAGNPVTHEVSVSMNGEDWNTVAYGTWFGDSETDICNVNYAVFQPTTAQHIRLTINSVTSGGFVRIAEVRAYEASRLPDSGAALGRWGPTIDFPIVPVGAWVDPLSGKVVTFSSNAHDQFSPVLDPQRPGKTYTATWDPASKIITQRLVSNTKHDMFCPGMSLNSSGYMHVSGGNSASRLSISRPKPAEADPWTRGPQMSVPRGYQSSVTCDDGRIFVIGGSFGIPCDPAGLVGQFKDGEVYDPHRGSWTKLPQSKVRYMFTAERSGNPRECQWFRSDNHGWLFPWKNHTVFQAGPSVNMNWYTATEPGGHMAAGPRGDARDSMCGVAVMYDASKGSILTAGGSLTYTDSDATKNSYLISLADANGTVQTSRTQDMAHQRIFHSAVILPNGETLVTGGGVRGAIFTDDFAVFEPEKYSPTTHTWTPMALQSIPRTYHSLALLLPDATLFVAGGGLCEVDNGGCSANHYDAQIFTPPYLLTGAKRPLVQKVSKTEILAGSTITLKTDSPIDSASIIRYGSATHGLNTDQRRVPLPLSLSSSKDNEYTVQIPKDSGVVIPGYWMLFVMKHVGDQDVPSVATSIQVGVSHS